MVIEKVIEKDTEMQIEIDEDKSLLIRTSKTTIFIQTAINEITNSLP